MSQAIIMLAFAWNAQFIAQVRGKSELNMEEVRRILNSEEFDRRKELYDSGQNCFAIYESILKDKNATTSELSRIYIVLRIVNVENKNMFMKQAKRDANSEHINVRQSVVDFLCSVTNNDDVLLINTFIWDDELTINMSAAKKLSEVGDENVLPVFDAWLRINAKKPAGHVKMISEYRDALSARLKK